METRPGVQSRREIVFAPDTERLVKFAISFSLDPARPRAVISRVNLAAIVLDSTEIEVGNDIVTAS